MDVSIVGTWGALWERMESAWTLTWLAQGCCVGTDGVESTKKRENNGKPKAYQRPSGLMQS